MYRMVLLSLIVHFLQGITVVDTVEDPSSECSVTCDLESERAAQVTSAGAQMSVRGRFIH